MADDTQVSPAPVHELSREVVRLLMVASDSGEPVHEQTLREELGLGHDDLRGILEQLSARGMAEEVTPGEWTGVFASDAPPEPVRVKVPDPEPESSGGAMAEPRHGRGMLLTGEVGVARLTTAMVDALGDDALGALVRAGVAGADGGSFVLEVTP